MATDRQTTLESFIDELDVSSKVVKDLFDILVKASTYPYCSLSHLLCVQQDFINKKNKQRFGAGQVSEASRSTTRSNAIPPTLPDISRYPPSNAAARLGYRPSPQTVAPVQHSEAPRPYHISREDWMSSQFDDLQTRQANPSRLPALPVPTSPLRLDSSHSRRTQTAADNHPHDSDDEHRAALTRDMVDRIRREQPELTERLQEAAIWEQARQAVNRREVLIYGTTSSQTYRSRSRSRHDLGFSEADERRLRREPLTPLHELLAQLYSPVNDLPPDRAEDVAAAAVPDRSWSPPSPRFAPRSPRFAPVSPRFDPASPQLVPRSPRFAPTSPRFAPTSPRFAPRSPDWSPASPTFTPSGEPARASPLRLRIEAALAQRRTEEPEPSSTRGASSSLFQAQPPDSNSTEPLSREPSTLRRTQSLRRLSRRFEPRPPIGTDTSTELRDFLAELPPAQEPEQEEPQGPFSDFQGWTSRRRRMAREEREAVDSSLDVDPRHSELDVEVLGSSSSVAALADREAVHQVVRDALSALEDLSAFENGDGSLPFGV
jgi:hypothetical protein